MKRKVITCECDVAANATIVSKNTAMSDSVPHLKCAHLTSWLAGEQESGLAAALIAAVAAAVAISRVTESCASASFAASEALRSSCSRHTGNAHSPARRKQSASYQITVS